MDFRTLWLMTWNKNLKSLMNRSMALNALIVRIVYCSVKMVK